MAGAGRVGILGGTFDPPHNAHLMMAQAALQRIPLDEILFMPAPAPPLKDPGRLTPYAERVEMVELAVRGQPGLRLSRLEEFRTGPSFTVELLRRYREQYVNEPFLIVGADSVQELPSWREPVEILALATIVVFARTGYSLRIPVEDEAAVIVFESPVIDISSTEIRSAIRAGRPVRSFLPEAVLEFALDTGLYT
jgi:nicotinate-nucleotide adenylyltransferase